MRLLTGDECGLLKEFVPEIAHAKQQHASSGKKDIVLPTHYDIMQKINSQHGIHRLAPDEPQSRTRGVIALTMVQDDSDNDNDPFTFAALRQNGSVQMWQGTKPARDDHHKNKFAQYQPLAQVSGNIFETMQAKSAILDQVPVTPLAMECIQTKNDPRLVACDTHGHVVILKAEEDQTLSILHQFSAWTNTPDNSTLTYTKGKVLNRQFASAMAVHSDTNTVAIGGRERDVRLVDLETGKATWKAKNLPPDPQTLLQQPLWPSAMTFWTPPHLLAVGTAFGQVRLYDVRVPPHQTTSLLRRPIQYTPLDDAGVHEHRITALCPLSPHRIVAGDTTGDLHVLDLRHNFHGQRANKQINGTASTGRFVGPSGSIRQLVRHKTLPVLAVVGCDRMLRTYDIHQQKIIDCVYLKQRLNCVLMCSEERMDEEDPKDKDDADVDQEDIVRDYVDSDDEDDGDTPGIVDNGGQHVNEGDESDSDSDDEKEMNAAGNKNKAQQNSDDEEEDDSENKSASASGSGSAAGSSDSIVDEDESSSEDETPRKRRRQ